MPELPEIETFRRTLLDGTPENPSIIGKRIRETQLLWERTLAEPTPEKLRRRIVGQTIQDIGRRAKYLLVKLDRDTLVFHLRMSGDLLVEKESDPVAPHHRFLVIFEDSIRLAFNDIRKFGRVWLLEDTTPLLKKLGPEPLDKSLTPDIFHSRISIRRRQLKPLLLDQSFLAGLGNIYTDEALHRSHLHPQTLASSLNQEKSANLLQNIREVLKAGIAANGASIDWVYRGGGFQNQFQVYQRKGEPCYQCGTPIERIVVGQRGTHICPQCQTINHPS
jgi:formamidopyrimidine-DNA glycosylase